MAKEQARSVSHICESWVDASIRLIILGLAPEVLELVDLFTVSRLPPYQIKRRLQLEIHREGHN